jgi:hypothetical protein
LLNSTSFSIISTTITGRFASRFLKPRLKQVASELTNQYVVTYGRPETLIPPEKIDVTVSRPGLTARARTRTGQVGAK